jgi:tetratricopeptide (TPR) repeat protein
LIQRGDFVAAREVLLKVLDRRDEIQDVAFQNKLLELLAWTWTLTDEHRERAVFFSEYLSRYPTDVRAHTLRAGAFWYAGDFHQAIEDYSDALNLDSKEILARVGRGQVYAEVWQYREAIDDLDFADENLDRLATEGASWTAQARAFSFNGRALAYAGLGETERAMAGFNRSIHCGLKMRGCTSTEL